MKTTDPDSGSVYVVPSYTHPRPKPAWAINPEHFPKVGVLEALTIEPLPGVFKVAVTLDTIAEQFVYIYPAADEGDADHKSAVIMSVPGFDWYGLIGGKYFNYFIRPTCEGKFPE